MADVFISYAEEDDQLAKLLAHAMETAGFTTWLYTRDSVAGPSYLTQSMDAIEQSQAVLLLISRDSLHSQQVTSEVVFAHESNKRFVPIRVDVTHVEFQTAQREWRAAIGSATALQIQGRDPSPVFPRIIAGLRSLGVRSNSMGSTGEAAAGQTPGVAPTVPPKPEPQTIVVDALHRGDHTNLTDALKAAKPGDRILIRPGLYREGIVIDKPVEIIGDGKIEEIVIEAIGKDVVLFRASMGRIANLTLRQAGGGEWHGIDISQGQLDVEGCDITSQSLDCVIIHNGADPTLNRNRIHGGCTYGVTVSSDGQGTLEDNDIFDNTDAGVSITTGGNPMLRQNRIHDGRWAGVSVCDNGQGMLEDNDIFANWAAGVEVSTGSNPTLRRNRIHDGEVGVRVCDNGLGILEDNQIFANEGEGVSVMTGGKPTLRRNNIHNGESDGVVICRNGLGILEDNQIFANEWAGVRITIGGNPTLRRNRITKNGQAAISVHEDGRGVFEENDLRQNTGGAWDVSPECLAKVTRTRNQE